MEVVKFNGHYKLLFDSFDFVILQFGKQGKWTSLIIVFQFFKQSEELILNIPKLTDK